MGRGLDSRGCVGGDGDEMNRHIKTIRELLICVAATRNVEAREPIEDKIGKLAKVAAEDTLTACFEDLARRGGDWLRLSYEAYHMRRDEYFIHPLERVSSAIGRNDGTLEAVLWASAIWDRAYHSALSGREAVTL